MDIKSHLMEGVAVLELAAARGLTIGLTFKQEFLVGCVRPDLSKDKDAAHYYFDHRESGWRAPDLVRFRAAVEAAGGWTPELLGVYTHLAADTLFFREFVARKLSDGTILAKDGTKWENGGAYKRASLYKTYEANRVVPCRELEYPVRLVREAEPGEMKLSELTLAKDWRDQFLSFVDPIDRFPSPVEEEVVGQLRGFARSAAEELVAEGWFMTALRKALGA